MKIQVSLMLEGSDHYGHTVAIAGAKGVNATLTNLAAAAVLEADQEYVLTVLPPAAIPENAEVGPVESATPVETAQAPARDLPPESGDNGD
jgi:hypothetical protein